MPSIDTELEDIILKLSQTRITEYSQETAKECLTSALEKIDCYERRMLKTLNAELQAAGPFYVQSLDNQIKPTCSITFGKRLIYKIERNYGVGSKLRIDKSALSTVLRIDEHQMTVSNDKREIKSGSFPVEFFYVPGKQKAVLDAALDIEFNLFPTTNKMIVDQSSAVDLLPTSLTLNEIQKDAIAKALQPQPLTVPRPIPFLIRGPPGTGKTTTLIEMVLQILAMEEKDKDPFVIVCTPSNRAADNVIERFPPSKASILRLITVAEEFKWESRKKVPGIDYSTRLSSPYDVVVSTIGKLQSFYKEDGILKTSPTHLIIDEASMVADTEMILVLGLLRSDTKFIMFGDDKQLGPVIKVDNLRHSYLITSMFERLLMDKNHERASVCLLENYRSCPGAVAPFNNLFYDRKLIAKVTPEKYPEIFQQLQLIHGILMGPDSTEEPTGVYFRSVKGGCGQSDSMSWSNVKEAKEIVKIFNALLDSGVPAAEIGIITPYTDQVNLIKDRITHSSVVIGSVDSFQGQERNVILISTVRSFNNRGIGFVGDKKRLNVTLSRAKTALVIVGNDIVLKRNKLFKKFFKLGGIHFIK